MQKLNSLLLIDESIYRLLFAFYCPPEHVSGAGAGGRRNWNDPVSWQNLPFIISSTIKPLQVKS